MGIEVLGVGKRGLSRVGTKNRIKDFKSLNSGYPHCGLS